MTQYNTLNVKISNSQVNELKHEIKNGTKVILRLILRITENNFPHKLY